MPTLAQKPATTPIPVQLSATEFQQFILPHLSMPKRGPKCKLGYHHVFNLILWVLYTPTVSLGVTCAVVCTKRPAGGLFNISPVIRGQMEVRLRHTCRV